MNSTPALLASPLLLVLGAVSAAPEPAASPPPVVAAPSAADESVPAVPAPVDLQLAQVAWLAGSWRAESEHRRQEEHWLAPDGGLMLGLNRSVSATGRVFFEFLRIEQRPDGVVYLASPAGRPPTPFRLVEATPVRAVFTNPEHDFPQRITYTLDGDTLRARIDGEGRQPIEWAWTRATFLR